MPGGAAQAPVAIDDGRSLNVTRGFPARLDSAREARHFVLSLLEPRLDPLLVSDAAIIIAELAANVVQHARSPFRVRVTESGGIVRISVVDAALMTVGGLVTVPGHGLDVVSKVALRWAAEPRSSGKVVWAELHARPRGLS